MIKKIGKIVLGALLLLFTLGAILFAIYNEPLPSGIKSQNADALAMKMLTALHYEA